MTESGKFIIPNGTCLFHLSLYLYHFKGIKKNTIQKYADDILLYRVNKYCFQIDRKIHSNS